MKRTLSVSQELSTSSANLANYQGTSSRAPISASDAAISTAAASALRQSDSRGIAYEPRLGRIQESDSMAFSEGRLTPVSDVFSSKFNSPEVTNGISTSEVPNSANSVRSVDSTRTVDSLGIDINGLTIALTIESPQRPSCIPGNAISSATIPPPNSPTSQIGNLFTDLPEDETEATVSIIEAESSSSSSSSKHNSTKRRSFKPGIDFEEARKERGTRSMEVKKGKRAEGFDKRRTKV
jgi:hypothetical protein